MNLHEKSRTYIPIFVFLLAVITYGLYGFNEYLSYDSAVYAYSGQRLAEGIPPYISIFDNKGPLSPFFAGFGAIFAKIFSIDSVFSIRLVFFLLSCLSVVSVYLLTKLLTQSAITGLFSSITFLSFQDFAFYAGSGPQAKTPMVLFETLYLLFTVRKKWFLAGFCGSLAFLVWQPCAIFPVATIAIAAFQPYEKKFSAVLETFFGILIPVFLVSVYFIYYNALPDLIDGMILFNFLYREQPDFSILPHIKQPLEVLIIAYRVSLIPILFGLVMIFLLYFLRKQHNKSWKKALFNDSFSIIFLTYPLPFIWSFLDFQGAPDFYVFLPYASLGFGIFINYAVQKIYSDFHNGNLLTRTLPVFMILIALLIAPITTSLREKNNDFVLQKKAALEIKKRFGDNVKLLSISAPELLALLEVSNPNRYVSIKHGIVRYIDSKYADGFDGFLKEIKEYNPDIIGIDAIYGTYDDKLMRWIEGNYKKEVVGPFQIYVSNKNTPKLRLNFQQNLSK